MSDVAQVFSELAPLWHERRATGETSRLAREVARVLRAGGDVLDVGCGTGELLDVVRVEAAAAGKSRGRLVGLDLAPGMVTLARQRTGIEAMVGDATSLPLADQVFDVVVCNHVLHFGVDPVRAARELVRVAKPGGTVFVGLRMGARSKKTGLDGLPDDSLLRRYLVLERRSQTASFRRTLERLGCRIRELTAPEAVTDRRAFLRAVASASGSLFDLDLADRLAADGRRPRSALWEVRLPGPRRGRMPVRVENLDGITAAGVRQLLSDLPRAYGYEVVVKPLRYRTRPHVQAWCEFTDKRITIQIPVPFRPFDELIPYRAKRLRAKGLRFRWYTRTLRFERPDELIRYLYLHEYYHWYLREVLGQKSAAETACDRFALQRM